MGPKIDTHAFNIGQVLTVLSIVAITSAGLLRLATAENQIEINKQDIKEQSVISANFQHFLDERDMLMSIYTTQCARSIHKPDSPECVQAGVWHTFNLKKGKS